MSRNCNAKTVKTLSQQIWSPHTSSTLSSHGLCGTLCSGLGWLVLLLISNDCNGDRGVVGVSLRTGAAAVASAAGGSLANGGSAATGTATHTSLVFASISAALFAALSLAVGGLHADVAGLVVVLKLRVIQRADGALHVGAVAEVNNSVAIAINISKNNVAAFAHKVFQILPTASTRQIGDDNSIVGAATASLGARSLSSLISLTTC